MEDKIFVKEGKMLGLRHVDNYGKWLDFGEFMDEAKKQLETYKMKNFSPQKFKITKIDEVLTGKRFLELCKTAKSMGKGKYYPIMTLHGTSSPENINSIVKHGYLETGDINRQTGYIRTISNGSYYGEGIYSSIQLNVSEWYSFLDRWNCVQVIVNIVLLGNVEIIKMDEDHPGGLNIPIHGIYHNKYHTRAFRDMSVVVSGSSKYIVPVFVITASPLMDFKKYREPSFRQDVIDEKEKEYRSWEKLDLSKIVMRRVVRDFYTIELEKVKIEKVRKKKKWKRPEKVKLEYRYHYVVPLSLQSGKTFDFFEKSVKNFISSVEGKKKLWFYDKDCKSYAINFEDAFSSHLKSHKKWKGEKLYNAMGNVFESITKDNVSKFVEVVYVFVNRPKDGKKEYDKLVKNHQNYVKMKKVWIKLIFMEKCDYKNFFPLKFHMQTLNFWDEMFYTNDTTRLTEIFEDLVLENRNIKFNNVHYKIPYPYGVAGEGFVSKFNENPSWDVKIHSVPLYKGQFLKYIMVNYDPNGSYSGVQPHRVMFQEEMNIKLASKTVLQILSEFRNYIFLDKRKFVNYENVIKVLCEGIMDVIDEKLKNIRQDNESRKLVSVIMGFYYKIRGLLSDMTTYCGVSFKGKYFESLRRMKFSKGIVKRVKHEFDLQKLIKEVGCKLKEPADALTISQKMGMSIFTFRSNASMVEPWLLMVKRVSPKIEGENLFPVSKIYNFNELGKVIKDSEGKEINDVMIDETDFTEVGKMYYSYVFTRNPYLYISSQRFALPVISLVSLVETFFMKYILGSKDFNEEKKLNMLSFIIDMVKRVKNLLEKDVIINSALDKIINENDVEKYFTETHGIVSVCMILGGLTLDKSKLLFDQKEKFHRICFGLLAECIMRECRVFLKSNNEDENQHIRKILGIKDDVDVDTYKFCLKDSKRRTNRFYAKKFTNCTPFAVVPLIEILERIHKGKKILDIKSDFDKKVITMKNFLKKHLSGELGSYTQIALFLQGMKFHKSKYRQNVSFKEPKNIITTIVKEQLDMIVRKRQILEMRDNMRNRKRQRLVEKAGPFILFHKTVKLFDWMEVNKLNLSRPDDDQLELTTSGLLKHHCCYPDCPDFLKNFATEHDKLYKTRHGIFRHLKYNFLVLNLHVPSFHLVARSLLRAKGVNKLKTFEEFVKKMDEYFMGEQRLRNFYVECSNKEESLKSVWKFYRKEE